MSCGAGGAELIGEPGKLGSLEPTAEHATQRSAQQPTEVLLAALREPATNAANRFDGGGSFLGDLSSLDAPNLGPSYLGKLDEPGGDWIERSGLLGKLDWDGFGQGIDRRPLEVHHCYGTCCRLVPNRPQITKMREPNHE